MMSVKDWVFSQVISKSIGSTRPLSASESFLSQDSQSEDLGSRGLSQTNPNLTSHPVSTETRCSLNYIQMTQNSLSAPQGENPSGPNHNIQEKDLEPLSEVEALQIKFLRSIKRLDLWQDDVTVAKVLYRIHLASLIRAGESDLKKAYLKSNRARAVAAKQEEAGLPELDYSLKILVLGKTGVGKSSTINSVLGESKVVTDAFRPSTNQIEEISGNLNGVKVSFIDTPGLLPPSSVSDHRNKKILKSVKRYVRKSRPDIILYFERLDLIDKSYPDFPLLKLITEVLGPSIWFSTNIVLTHSSAALPEGQNGYPVSYDSYVDFCTQVLQHHIHRAVLDSKLENPLILVENHPSCKVDPSGKKVLPNGQAWMPRFMLLCLCTKVLGDVNALLNFKDSIWLGPTASSRSPSLPHLLSSFLKHRMKFSPDGEDDEDFYDLLFLEPGDQEEYDQLPPIRVLTKAQFKKLSPVQKEDYLDELDYRETLFLKKQMRQEYTRKRTVENNDSAASGEYKDNRDQDEAPEPILLPDMAVPLSFDSDNPSHRFRCLVTGNRWIARPVLDPNGWDHDVGFDGINLEMGADTKNTVSYLTGQISKDKQDLNVQCESTLGFLGPVGPTYALGLDVLSSGRELICTARANAKVKNFGRNATECGISLTPSGDDYYCGAKIENTFRTGKWMDFRVNAGGVRGGGKAVFGGSLETTLRGRDYPMRDDKVCLGVSVIDFEKETVLGGNVEAGFRVGRGTRMSVSASVNSRRMGRVCVKVSSSEHMEMALVALVSVLRSLVRKNESKVKKNGEVGGEGFLER